MGDDTVGLFLNLFLLALIAGQKGLGLFAQRAGFIKLGLNALGALIKLFAKHARHLEVHEKADKDQERDQNDEVGVRQRDKRPRCRQRGAGECGRSQSG